MQGHDGNIDQLARRVIATANEIAQHVFGSEETQNASLAWPMEFGGPNSPPMASLVNIS